MMRLREGVFRLINEAAVTFDCLLEQFALSGIFQLLGWGLLGLRCGHETNYIRELKDNKKARM